MTHIDPKQKSSKNKLTNQKTAVWEKRQMGNVLLIIILGIRFFVGRDAIRLKSILLNKNDDLLAGPGWRMHFGHFGSFCTLLIVFGSKKRNFFQSFSQVRSKTRRRRKIREIRGTFFVDTFIHEISR